MIDFVGFGEGRRTNDREMKRQRRDLAQAFQEFTRSNPMATPAQFQAFIDSMSGGSNYLRDAMPSGDVLKKVQDVAAQNRNRFNQDREYEIFKRNYDLQKDMKSAVEDIMLNYADPGADGYTQEDFSKMSKSLTDQFSGTNFENMGLDVSQMFRGDIRRAAVAQRLQNYLPTLQTIINQSGGMNIDKDFIVSQFPNVPKALIEPLIEQATQLETERRRVVFTNEKDNMMADIKDAIANNLDPHQYLLDTGKWKKSDIPAKDSENMKRMISQSTLAHNEKINAADREKRRLGYEFTKELTSREDIRASLFEENRADTLNRIMSFAKSYFSDYDFQQIFGKEKGQVTGADFEQYLEPVEDSMSVIQRKEFTTGRKAAQSTAGDLAKDFKANNVKAVTERFGDLGESSNPTNTGVNGRNALVAVHELAKFYHMDSAMMQTVENILSENSENPLPEGMTATEVLRAIESDPRFKAASVGKSLSEVSNTLMQNHLDQFSPLEPMEFDVWLETQRTDVDELQNVVNDEIKKINQMFKGDPKNQVLALQTLESHIDKRIGAFNAKMENAKKSAKEHTGWIKPGSGPWRDADVFGESGESVMGALKSSVQEQKAKIGAAIAVSSALLPTEPNVPKGGQQGIDVTQDEGTVIGQMITDFTYDRIVDRDILDATGQFYQGSSLNPLNWVSIADPLKLYRKAKDELFATPAAEERQDKMQEWVNQNQRRLSEWGQVALSLGKETGDARYKQMYLKMLDDIMLPEGDGGISYNDFVKKYEPVLKALGGSQRQFIAPN